MKFYRVVFSQVISLRNGQLRLMFRVANLLSSQLLEAHVSKYQILNLNSIFNILELNLNFILSGEGPTGDHSCHWGGWRRQASPGMWISAEDINWNLPDFQELFRVFKNFIVAQKYAISRKNKSYKRSAARRKMTKFPTPKKINMKSATYRKSADGKI